MRWSPLVQDVCHFAKVAEASEIATRSEFSEIECTKNAHCGVKLCLFGATRIFCHAAKSIPQTNVHIIGSRVNPLKADCASILI